MAFQTTAPEGSAAQRLKYLQNSGSSLNINPSDSQTIANKRVSTIEIPISNTNLTTSSQSVINNNPTNLNNVYIKSFATILKKRFELMKRICIYNDLMAVLAIGGLILAIVVQQLINSKVFLSSDDSDAQLNHTVLVTLRCLITFSTIALVVLNVPLQVCIFNLRMLSTSRRSVVVLVRIKFIVLTAFELVPCIIHPLPWDFEINQKCIIVSAPFFDQKSVNVNVFPTLFMFVRFYLLARSIVHHHVLYRTRLAHLFRRVENVTVGYRFIFRSMDEYAGIVLCAIIAVVWIGGAWAIHCCEVNTNNPTIQYLNCLWIVIITFFTVGNFNYFLVYFIYCTLSYIRVLISVYFVYICTLYVLYLVLSTL